VRAEYGEGLIKRLSKDMTEKFGKGFSEMNVRNMRRFYLEFPVKSQKSETLSRKSTIQQTVSAEWQKNQAVSGKFQMRKNGDLTAHTNIPQ
jgi:hypothetical protein